MTALFLDRRDAGKQLAKKLSLWMERDDIIVLALPRGGAPVGFEVAQALHAPLDLMLVRKLGLPGDEEVAMGALALPGITVFNHDIVRNASVDQEDIDRIVAREARELVRRNQLYRHNEPLPDLKEHVVILVDDGMATGANMYAAVMAVRQQLPLHLVVAVPVASVESVAMIKLLVDDVVCLHTPEPFFGVGRFYQDFSQTSDEEVIGLLEQAHHWGKGHVNFEEEHKRVRYG